MVLSMLLSQASQLVSSIRGDVVEIGVYKGESALTLCKVHPSCTVHLFDTFCGMPELIGEYDIHRAGEFCDTSVDKVRNYLSGYDIRLHPGIFPENAIGVEHQPFKFAHVDVDLYKSTRDAFEWLWDRMAIGGVIFFDDYGAWSCPGATIAVEEFCAAKGIVKHYIGRTRVYVVKEASDES